MQAHVVDLQVYPRLNPRYIGLLSTALLYSCMEQLLLEGPTGPAGIVPLEVGCKLELFHLLFLFSVVCMKNRDNQQISLDQVVILENA